MNELLRHFVAALRYRTSKTIQDAPEGFFAFSPGSGVRTPVEILAHMGDVLTFAVRQIEGDSSYLGRRSEPGTWADEIGRFQGMLSDIAAALDARESLNTDLAERLLQGPLADAMTHVGQLAMLRRMAGSPVPGENFFAANIRPE